MQRFFLMFRRLKRRSRRDPPYLVKQKRRKPLLEHVTKTTKKQIKLYIVTYTKQMRLRLCFKCRSFTLYRAAEDKKKLVQFVFFSFFFIPAGLLLLTEWGKIKTNVRIRIFRVFFFLHYIFYLFFMFFFFFAGISYLSFALASTVRERSCV